MHDAWKRAGGAPQLGLAGLLLLLSLACASASAPVTPAPRVPTATPVADGIAQNPGQAATPTPPRTSKATSERTGEIPSHGQRLKGHFRIRTSEAAEPVETARRRPTREATMTRRRPSPEAAEPAATTRLLPYRIRAS